MQGIMFCPQHLSHAAPLFSLRFAFILADPLPFSLSATPRHHAHPHTHTHAPPLVAARLGVHLRCAADEHEQRGAQKRRRRRHGHEAVRLAQQVGEAAGGLGALEGGLAGLGWWGGGEGRGEGCVVECVCGLCVCVVYEGVGRRGARDGAGGAKRFRRSAERMHAARVPLQLGPTQVCHRHDWLCTHPVLPLVGYVGPESPPLRLRERGDC
jgi:hypothetical protein